MARKKVCSFVGLASASLLTILLAGGAQAALITIPSAQLNNSPGVYTSGGYYSTNLGSVVVTTGGGNAANVGDPTGRNDDGFSALNLGFNITYFGATYSSLFINTNGNVSFGAGISAYIPVGPTGAVAPVISPFFGDVDTRGSNSGVVHVNTSVTNQIIVTWDQVGFFDTNDSPLDSFQLVLRGDAFTAPDGEGKIGFFYQTMGWDVTDTSAVAAVGFGDGAGNGKVIQGSTAPGMAGVVNNKYIWFDANLQVVPPTDPGTGTVPEPDSLALFILALGVGMVSRKVCRV